MERLRKLLKCEIPSALPVSPLATSSTSRNGQGPAAQVDLRDSDAEEGLFFFDTIDHQPTTPPSTTLHTTVEQDFALWEDFVLAETPPVSRRRRPMASLPDSDNEEQQDAAQQVDSGEEFRHFLQVHLGE